MFQTVANSDDAKKAIAFIDLLNDHDDVQNVFSNLDIPDNLL